MEVFNKEFNGYNKKEVREYISTLELKSASRENTFKERINLLEEENIALKGELARLKDKETLLSDGLIRALEFERSIKKDIEVMRESEISRMEIFRAKWEEYAYELLHTDGGKILDKLEELKKSFIMGVEERLERDLKLKPDTKSLSDDAEKLSELCKKLGILEG